jgi:hypothetical protein
MILVKRLGPFPARWQAALVDEGAKSDRLTLTLRTTDQGDER